MWHLACKYFPTKINAENFYKIILFYDFKHVKLYTGGYQPVLPTKKNGAKKEKNVVFFCKQKNLLNIHARPIRGLTKENPTKYVLFLDTKQKASGRYRF